MKVVSRQLARAFFELVDGKADKEVEKIIPSLISFMAKENMLGKIDEFIHDFSAIWNASAGIVEAETVSAHPLDKQAKSELVKYISSKTGAKEVEIKEKNDDEQIGGIIINYQDKTARASLKDWISQLQATMSK
ncbi:MAG: F0F1 ATP synthase subunit delta [Smithellaceae bacterium]|jgi:F0F1-type ATP synthase delta subunit|nr:F0F1 ATP synthase subunit delta [Smithellaceae bacterium]